jgi:hypothetical protein
VSSAVSAYMSLQEGEQSVDFFYENNAPSKLNLGKDLLAFYRSFPCVAAKELLGVELVYTQRAMLNIMWHYPNVCEVLSRGMSKSFILALYAMLRMLLYSDITVGVVSKTYRQAQQVFVYVREINDRAKREGLFFFEDQMRKMAANSFATEIIMKHGSQMFAVPVGNDGDGGRGKRCHILLVDEAGIVPQAIVDKVVRAYLNVMPMNPLKWGTEGIETNQKVFCSSATYQWHWFYSEVCDYAVRMKESDLYYNLMLDYRDFEADPLSPYNLDWEQIKDAKKSTPKLEFKMEYMNYFIPEGHSFFSLDDLKEIRKGNPDYRVEKEGDPNSDYMIVLDPAETAGGDNFACGVWKLVPETKSIVPVYLKRWNDGISMERAAIFIRGLQWLFGAKMIVCDSKGGGAELIKQLTKTEDVDNTHASGKFPHLAVVGEAKGTRGWPIVHRVKFSSKLIETMGWDLAYYIEQHRLVFPKQDVTSPNPCIRETSELLVAMANEIGNVRTKASGQYTGFEARSGKKDFFTIAMMAARWANDWFEGKINSTKKRRKRLSFVPVVARAGI